MKDPVYSVVCLHSYDREAIFNWLDKGDRFCPICKAKLARDHLNDNTDLKKIIEKFYVSIGANMNNL